MKNRTWIKILILAGILTSVLSTAITQVPSAHAEQHSLGLGVGALTGPVYFYHLSPDLELGAAAGGEWLIDTNPAFNDSHRVGILLGATFKKPISERLSFRPIGLWAGVETSGSRSGITSVYSVVYTPVANLAVQYSNIDFIVGPAINWKVFKGDHFFTLSLLSAIIRVNF